MPAALGDDPPGRTLHLLAEVSWGGRALPGGRTADLLAALADADGRVVDDRTLVDLVWDGDEPPANPAKALQVVVSRARHQTCPEVLARVGTGYRLALDAGRVDALVLRRGARAAATAESRGETSAARDHARAALGTPAPVVGGSGPLARLRSEALRHRTDAEGVLARTLSALGEHEEALPLLEGLAPLDERGTAALLRSTAAVRGTAAALDRYDAVSRDLADRLGVDPGPGVRTVHAELLAADAPVRTGVRYAATPLVGREDDVRALRAAVRESRVVSVLGPGGLGKTRLAQLLAQEAEQPVVHVVELVGVTAPEDVVGEIGSALGVRDSVAGRRVLTPAQRADVRARIAQVLEPAPALLVLDNCEQVVEAVAALVAFLVATCPRLRVVTTTRAPLAIAAERVFALAQLDDAAAAELFAQRARAARPGVTLEPEAVRRVVGRLDGLPLAVELAAARVRAMSVEDVARRLDDRFALLRGSDPSAPDRHRTLLAVIDWSWNLLAEPERRALRRLSVFHDGFSLEAADTLLDADALPAVQALVDQSLLTVVEAGHGVRYRMLETVREFGRIRLVEAGEEHDAHRARRAWACGLADRASATLWSADQVAAVRALAAEEGNLADCLREALSAPDPVAVVRLVSALGAFWTIRGENVRVIALTGAVDAALEGWSPAPDEVDVAVAAASLVGMNTIAGEIARSGAAARILAEVGDQATSPRVRATVRVLAVQDHADPDATLARLDEIGAGPDREAAQLARMWAAHHRENVGSPERAIVDAEAGLELARPEDGPWFGAMLHTFVASLNAQLGCDEGVLRHVEAALPVLDALEADDDAVQCRSLLAVHAMTGGRLEEAERWIDEIDRIGARRSGFGAAFVMSTARAELALARGQVAEGLRRYRVAVAELAGVTFPGLGPPTGLEPWALFGESAAATAYALHGDGVEGRDLYDTLLAKVPAVLAQDHATMDYPVAGLVLHGLGAWGLLAGAMDPEPAVRLLSLAEAFGYPRFTPSMRPERTDPAAEDRAPGASARWREAYAGRTAPDLLPEARAVLAQVPDAHILRA